ncbi:GntR family transcriptional regulator [Alkaliphilus peptidifermentans]|uniref:Transcriptional regulator, GntR family n=1 Tax=Alkaliphilus peptidifermentans DSM 18978 TaxID=1120976 RepID=A0A1G5J131_9FIRM|nr:GntR family transcriptional regulator [Alkaliphilus peptidifermentans]SCY81670.1 transcriptional regulator, GntR family [Alkaliphilus peptidifermentans DSM 18978]
MKKKSAEATAEECLVKEILNGNLKAHSMLRPERELAEMLGYSRPVIHKAIIRLEACGLVTIIPRRGVRVNDYRESGKLGLLESIYNLYRTGISRELNIAMLKFIQNNLEAILMAIVDGDQEKRVECCAIQEDCSIDSPEDVFRWMHSYALYCGNPIYPMLINEFKIGIINVGNVVLNGSQRQEFIKLLREVNGDLKVGHGPSLKDKLKALFIFIEVNWLSYDEKEGD